MTNADKIRAMSDEDMAKSAMAGLLLDLACCYTYEETIDLLKQEIE